MPGLSARAAAAVVAAACWMLHMPVALAMTTPDELSRAIALRDALSNRSQDWTNAMKTWTCPTARESSESLCDICSSDWSGNWEHLHCRGFSGPYGEGSVGEKDGRITTSHITDVNLDGQVPRQFCYLKSLREFDLDGGQLTGPIPRWFYEPAAPMNGSSNSNKTLCLANVQELDLSSNRLTGTLPPELAIKTTLQEVKFEHNYLTGTIPPELAKLSNMWRFRVQNNKMWGRVPDAFRSTSLNEIWMDNNDFEGDLSMLGPLKLMYALVHNNPRLCGMVPASVRFAHGYNPAGTGLGQPCPATNTSANSSTPGNRSMHTSGNHSNMG